MVCSPPPEQLFMNFGDGSFFEMYSGLGPWNRTWSTYARPPQIIFLPNMSAAPQRGVYYRNNTKDEVHIYQQSLAFVIHSLSNLPYSLIIPILIYKIFTAQQGPIPTPLPNQKSVPISYVHFSTLVIKGNLATNTTIIARGKMSNSMGTVNIHSLRCPFLESWHSYSSENLYMCWEMPCDAPLQGGTVHKYIGFMYTYPNPMSVYLLNFLLSLVVSTVTWLYKIII